MLEVLALAVALGDGGSASLVRIDDYAGRAASYSNAAGLAPLSPHDRSEVRVWSEVHLLGQVLGWVVTEESIRVYSNMERTESGVLMASADGPKLVRTITDKSARTILESLVALRRFNGQGFSCRVRDGVGYSIEGVTGGARFSFAASNPGHCSTPETQEIHLVLERLALSAPDAL